MKGRFSFSIPHFIFLLVFMSVGGTSVFSQASSKGAPWVGNAFSGAPCTGRNVEGGFGPYDYTQRSRYAKELRTVENAHFDSNVENLIQGKSTTNPLADISYTLQIWPNHHRALNSTIKARLRGMDTIKGRAVKPAECYFQRAINYSPNDATSHMLYAILLHRMERHEEALHRYQTAEKMDPGNLQVKYNMGLLLVDLGRYEEADNYASKVYSQGFPLPGLKRKLNESGYVNN